MAPPDDFTPFGYLDNPYHAWKLKPSGVLRSLEPLGMGWHIPNRGSYVNNQFQYTAHLNIGLEKRRATSDGTDGIRTRDLLRDRQTC